MRNIITFSSLAILLISSSVYADRWEDKKYKRVKESKHKVKRVDRPRGDVRHLRPQKRYPNRPYKSRMRRPKHTIVHHRRPGYRVNKLHTNAFHFVLGGLSYHYLSGAFYKSYYDGYRVVRAPVGALIYDLPHGYTRVYINDRSYYRYDDIYYRRDYDRSGYRVVEEPIEYKSYAPSADSFYQYQLGDILHNLPIGSIEVIIDGIRYYEWEGSYFLPSRENGETIYTVVEVY